MSCKHTGCTERKTAGESQVSPLREKLHETPHLLLLPRYTLVKEKSQFHICKIRKRPVITQ